MNLVIPRATEKGYNEQTKRTYIFNVAAGSTKQTVAKEVEAQYNVTVQDVRILVRKGKATKFSRGKHAYPGITHRQDKKIAYVTLKEGDSIRVFQEEEPAETNETKKEGKENK